jgi:Ribosomal protein L36e
VRSGHWKKPLTHSKEEDFWSLWFFLGKRPKPYASHMAPKAPKTGTNPSLPGGYCDALLHRDIFHTFCLCNMMKVAPCCSQHFCSSECKLTKCLGIAVGMNKGHVVQRRELPPRPSRRKGYLSQKTKAVRSLIKEVVGYLHSLPLAKTVLT